MSTTFPDAAPAARPAPKRVGRGPVATVLRPLASLQLTVALMGLSVGLVFFGTLAQKQGNIWQVVDQYFWSWVVFVDLNHLIEFGRIFFGLPSNLHAESWAKLPWPGGKLLGGLMFANLLAAHALRFRLTWKRSGIFLLHGGLLLLFVGEWITRERQDEQQIQILEGGSSSVAFDSRAHELAFVDSSGPATDRVVAIPATLLRRAAADKQRIRRAELPVDVEVLAYHLNSESRPAGPGDADNPATAGIGTEYVAVAAAPVGGVDTSERMDIPAAYVRLFRKGTDEQLGTFLVTTLTDPILTPRRWPAQTVTADGKTYSFDLRHTRHPKPYTLTLTKFTYEKYLGTNLPKTYASDLHLVDPDRSVDLNTTVSMNSPLRYGGETFYQSGYSQTAAGQQTTLQVVRNPGWLIPYISCVLVTVGMLLHFGITLVAYLRKLLLKPATAGPAKVFTLPPRTWVDALLPPLVVVAALGYLVGASVPRPVRVGDLDLTAVARLPVVDGGRVKPLDTVARVTLRLMNGREQFYAADDREERNPLPAVKWLLDTAAARGPGDLGLSAKHRVFRIESDQVQNLLGLKPREGLRYSLDEILLKRVELDAAIKKAMAKPEKDQDLFDKHLLELSRHLKAAIDILQGESPLLMPPADGREWAAYSGVREGLVLRVRAALDKKVTELGLPRDPKDWPKERQAELAGLIQSELDAARTTDPAAAAWDDLLTAYKDKDNGKLQTAVTTLSGLSAEHLTSTQRFGVKLETFLNESALYYRCTFSYLMAGLVGLAGLLAVLAYPAGADALRRAAFWWLVVTLAAHTFTLFARMYLMDRPLVFVTNLYSSAVFIGWAGVMAGLLVERLFPLGLGNLVAACMGAATASIAHMLAASGDTLEMMRAVLDTNFWLATHVTTIALGYSATYLAAAFGLAYVGLSLLPKAVGVGRPVTVGRGAAARPMELGRVIGQIIYGVVCAATLLSFVGTVLGGIWADQSWGRFWGWDPKENGAVLIVLWNALILHARWCGLVRDRGTAVLTLVGAMITTWSWFGTNQLGVGLHAYGFSKELAVGCRWAWVGLGVAAVGGLVPWHRLHADGSKR